VLANPIGAMKEAEERARAFGLQSFLWLSLLWPMTFSIWEICSLIASVGKWS
jgi:hypothetical protein